MERLEDVAGLLQGGSCHDHAVLGTRERPAQDLTVSRESVGPGPHRLELGGWMRRALGEESSTARRTVLASKPTSWPQVIGSPATPWPAPCRGRAASVDQHELLVVVDDHDRADPESWSP